MSLLKWPLVFVAGAVLAFYWPVPFFLSFAVTLGLALLLLKPWRHRA